MSQQSLFEEYPHEASSPEIKMAIMESGFANLTSQIGSSVCQELFQDFRNFVAMCIEPGGQTFKDALTYSVNGRGNGDYWIDYRMPGTINSQESTERSASLDHKYVYHHGPTSARRAKTTLGTELPKDMRLFLEKCDDLYHQGRTVARAALKGLGMEPVMFNGALVDDVHHLRLIDYVASGEPILGEEHFDRSVATLAIDESDTGLVGAPGQNGYFERYPNRLGDVQSYRTHFDPDYWLGKTLLPIEHRDKIIKLFLGAGANRLSQNIRQNIAELPLLGHGIHNDRLGQSRQAVVMFLNPHNQFKNYVVPTRYETGFGDIRKKLQQTAA